VLSAMGGATVWGYCYCLGTLSPVTMSQAVGLISEWVPLPCLSLVTVPVSGDGVTSYDLSGFQPEYYRGRALLY